MIVVNLQISCSLQIILIDQKQRYEEMVCLCQTQTLFAWMSFRQDVNFKRKTYFYIVFVLFITVLKKLLYSITAEERLFSSLLKKIK